MAEINTNSWTDYEYQLYLLALQFKTEDQKLTDLLIMNGTSLTTNPDYADAVLLAQLAYDKAHPIRRDYY